MSMNIEFTSDFYPSVCCEVCGEVYLWEFDCPTCKEMTGAELDQTLNVKEFECMKCETIFEFKELDYDIYDRVFSKKQLPT